MNKKRSLAIRWLPTALGAALTLLTYTTTQAQPTAQAWNKGIVGWNLGNQLECPAPGMDGESMTIGQAKNAINAEISWGNPVVSEATIKAIREAGFNAIRLPVRWGCHITNASTMTIDPAWLDRVKTIVDWSLAQGLKVIVNTHHDKWLEGRPTYAYQDENNRRLSQLWTNIAKAFAHYDYRLAFAGTNEVHVKDNWGKPTKENLSVQNSYNQAFVEAVRATGGNNLCRHLIVQTYVCNPDFGLYDGDFVIPTDRQANGNDYMSVEFHYYTPWDYAGECKYYFWGEAYRQYGATPTQGEKAMADFFDRVAATWAGKGLGVVIGEWGVTDHYQAGNADIVHENMTYYCRLLTSEALKRGFSTFIWDNNAFGNGQEKFGIFDRGQGMKVRATWIMKGIAEGLATGIDVPTLGQAGRADATRKYVSEGSVYVRRHALRYNLLGQRVD